MATSSFDRYFEIPPDCLDRFLEAISTPSPPILGERDFDIIEELRKGEELLAKYLPPDCQG